MPELDSTLILKVLYYSRKYLHLVLLFILLLYVIILFTIKYDKDSYISFINVGNSDSILIKYEKTFTLVDGGDDNSSLVYFSYLNFLRECKFENVILTHPHKDHLFGLFALLKKCKTDNLFFNRINFDSNLYFNFLESVDSNIKINQIHTLYKGDNIKISDLNIHVLWPPKNFTDENPNNHSITLLLDHKDFEVLFLGDLEYLYQENLIQDPYIQNIDLPLEVIKVPHQGSIDALNKNLLLFLKPRIAIFSVGDNSYGHPNPETIGFYRQIGSKIMRTDDLGTMIIDIPEMPSEQ